MKKLQKKTIKEYIVVFQEEKEGGYSVWVPELPGCASQGETIEESLGNIREAIELYLQETHNDTSSYSYKNQFVVPVQIYA